jgi:cell wall-associated NlpC family hydrolase
LVLAAALLLLLPAPSPAAEESLGNAIKKIFVSPTPAPKKRYRSSSHPSSHKKPAPEPEASASPEASSKPTPTASKKKHKTSPAPTPSQTPALSPTATVSPSPGEGEKKKGSPATLAPEQIVDYERYSPETRRLLDLSLDLTRRNLSYKYGSADPANGGMDCSGFVNYVLSQSGVRDVPRDSSQQYVWLRKLGAFRPVNSNKDDSFELEELRPGDLLFWTGTYSIERDPPITHSMIYLGREKGTDKRVMVGASDGRTYGGEARYGVSVFDFKVAQPPRDNDARMRPRFIGYGHVPGVSDH